MVIDLGTLGTLVIPGVSPEISLGGSSRISIAVPPGNSKEFHERISLVVTPIIPLVDLRGNPLGILSRIQRGDKISSSLEFPGVPQVISH